MTDIYDVAMGAVRQVSSARRSCSAAFGAYFCSTWATRNQASRAMHCLIGHEGRSPSDLLASGRLELEQHSTVRRAWTTL